MLVGMGRVGSRKEDYKDIEEAIREQVRRKGTHEEIHRQDQDQPSL